MMRKRILFAAIVLAFFALSIVSLIAYANKDALDDATISGVKESLMKITNGEFGDILVKERASDGKKKILILAEDNKFKYKINSESGKLSTVITKNMEDFNVKGNVSKDQLDKLAEKYLEKYVPASKGCKYILVSHIDSTKNSENCHEFVFNEIAQNDVKTGAGVSLSINNRGEFIALANHEGNPEIALNSKPRLNRNEAVKIATDFIKEQPNLKNVKNLPQDESELTVWENKLVWKVEINNIENEGTDNGYIFYIDANNGEIVYKDNYCALK